MDAVTLRHVDKAYTSYSTEIVITGEQRQSRTRQVLKDLSVTFAAGQLTVIVGRSGCGKSTLLKLLAGKEQPDAGEISIPQGWHSAMLSPDPYVITWTNVQRNVAMACGVGKTPEERYEKAADFVRLVGLEDYADLTPMELSTGMKQRLGLARILASQAQLLLMDEPFGALDAQTRTQLQTELLATWEREKKTCFFITHDVEEAIILAQRVVIMSARPGRIKRIETCLGTGESYFRAMAQLGYSKWQGKSVVIFGSGKVGSGLITYAHRYGSRITVVTRPGEITDRIRALCDVVIDASDGIAIAEAVSQANAVVTATGVPGAATAACPADVFIRSKALLANMGVEDEFGAGVPAGRVLEAKRPLNFILKDPTLMKYIDATMALHNEGAVILASKKMPAGLLEPDAATEERLLSICRERGIISDELNYI